MFIILAKGETLMRHSTSSFKLLAVLFAVLILVLGCSDPEKTKVEHYNKGMEYVNNENWKSAILEFQNAVQADPKYADARYQLGLAYLKDDQPKKAFSELLRATSLKPENLDAQLIVGQMLFSAKQFDESRERALKILEIDPEYVDALTLLAFIQSATGQFQEAEEYINKAISIEPERSDSYINKALILAAQNSDEEAENLFLQAIELAPDNKQNYQTLLKFYRSQGDVAKSKAFLEQIIEKFPDLPEPYLVMAELYLQQGDFTKAEENFHMAIKVSPDKPVPYILLGNFYKNLARFDEAENVYKEALPKAENPDEVKAVIADFYFEQKKFDQAEQLVNEMLQHNNKNPQANLVKSKLLIQDGKNAEAFKILDELLEFNPKWGEVYLLKGIAFLNQGETELSLKAANEAAKYIPQDSKVHTLLAQLYFLKRECAAAKTEAMTAVQLNPTSLHRDALIIGQCLFNEKEYDQALTIFSEMDHRYPNSPEIMYLKAKTHMALGDIPEAQTIGKKILADNPGYLPALQMLVGIALQNQNLTGALDLVSSQLEKKPENVDYLILAGRLNLLAGKYEEALVFINKAQKLAPSAPESYNLMAGAYIGLGKIDLAIDEFQKLTEVNPTLETPHMAIAVLMEAKGDKESAQEHYAKALELNPEFAPAANNLAWMMAEEEGGDLGEAMRLALVAKEQYPEDPYIADTLGWVHYKRQSYSWLYHSLYRQRMFTG